MIRHEIQLMLSAMMSDIRETSSITDSLANSMRGVRFVFYNRKYLSCCWWCHGCWIAARFYWAHLATGGCSTIDVKPHQYPPPLLSWERDTAASRKILFYFCDLLALAAMTTVSSSVRDRINIPVSKCGHSHQTQDSHSQIELDYVDFFCCVPDYVTV